MTRQFILIDHSIEGSSGHYLEYARRVLRAAKAEGFRTILAANKRAGNLDCPEADLILKPFTRTFWENQAQSKIRTVVSLFRKQSALVIDPLLSFHFADELRVLIRKASITESDIVFIPTLGGTELVGISLYSSMEAATKVSWHLLFRRDVPTPNSIMDARNYLAQVRIRAAFIEADMRFKKGSRHFYTDTEELTAQYSKLNVGDFKTLPIPIDEQLGVKRKWLQGPLVVSYLGDMREEKGIHLLPKLISAVRKDGFDETKVIFRIQGNLPAGGSTRVARRIKASLSNKKLPGIEILDGPLDSDAYREFILNSDIILIPYCPKRYAARSSGIFAEALAAGVPTIYPRASWMENNAAGSLALGYQSQAELAESLKNVLKNYQVYQSASLGYCEQWREVHSAKKLTRLLVENAAL